MKDKFYSWYKRRFDSLSQEPPEDLWEGISDALDKQGTIPAPSKGYSNRIAGGVALLLLGSVSWLFLSKGDYSMLPENKNLQPIAFSTHSENKSKTPEVINREKIQYNTNGNHRSSITIVPEAMPLPKRKGEIPEKSNTLKSVSNKKPDSQALKNLPTILSPATGDITEKGMDNQDFSVEVNRNATDNNNHPLAQESVNNTINLSTPLQTEKGLLLPTDNITSDAIEDSLLNKYIETSHFPRGFYIGSLFTINNSWLLNQDTYDGLKASGLNDAKMYFGNAFALITGYNFSDKMGGQAEWLLYNKQGQKYKDYIAGKMVNRNELLTYRQYNIIIKNRNSQLISNRNIPISFNTVLGLHYAHLKSANQVINGEKFESNDYQKNNYGVILGVGVETYVYKHLMLVTSLRGDIGFKNIYSGSQRVPANFKKTYNSSLGINLTAAYLIPSKKHSK